jgi:hypothetical protein
MQAYGIEEMVNQHHLSTRITARPVQTASERLISDVYMSAESLYPSLF